MKTKQGFIDLVIVPKDTRSSGDVTRCRCHETTAASSRPTRRPRLTTRRRTTRPDRLLRTDRRRRPMSRPRRAGRQRR